jgi:hypothetical protein
MLFKFVTVNRQQLNVTIDPTRFINLHKICFSILLLHRETLVLSYKTNPLFLCLHKTIESRIVDASSG